MASTSQRPDSSPPGPHPCDAEATVPATAFSHTAPRCLPGPSTPGPGARQGDSPCAHASCNYSAQPTPSDLPACLSFPSPCLPSRPAPPAPGRGPALQALGVTLNFSLGGSDLCVLTRSPACVETQTQSVPLAQELTAQVGPPGGGPGPAALRQGPRWVPRRPEKVLPTTHCTPLEIILKNEPYAFESMTSPAVLGAGRFLCCALGSVGGPSCREGNMAQSTPLGERPPAAGPTSLAPGTGFTEGHFPRTGWGGGTGGAAQAQREQSWPHFSAARLLLGGRAPTRPHTGPRCPAWGWGRLL